MDLDKKQIDSATKPEEILIDTGINLGTLLDDFGRNGAVNPWRNSELMKILSPCEKLVLLAGTGGFVAQNSLRRLFGKYIPANLTRTKQYKRKNKELDALLKSYQAQIVYTGNPPLEQQREAAINYDRANRACRYLHWHALYQATGCNPLVAILMWKYIWHVWKCQLKEEYAIIETHYPGMTKHCPEGINIAILEESMAKV